MTHDPGPDLPFQSYELLLRRSGKLPGVGTIPPIPAASATILDTMGVDLHIPRRRLRGPSEEWSVCGTFRSDEGRACHWSVPLAQIFKQKVSKLLHS